MKTHHLSPRENVRRLGAVIVIGTAICFGPALGTEETGHATLNLVMSASSNVTLTHEPLYLSLRLTNDSRQDLDLKGRIADWIRVRVKAEGQNEFRRWVLPANRMMASKLMRASIPFSTGDSLQSDVALLLGWSELSLAKLGFILPGPGVYQIEAEFPGDDRSYTSSVSNTISVKVQAPTGREAEAYHQYWTLEAAKFFLQMHIPGRETATLEELEKLVDFFRQSRYSDHARYALGIYYFQHYNRGTESPVNDYWTAEQMFRDLVLHTSDPHLERSGEYHLAKSIYLQAPQDMSRVHRAKRLLDNANQKDFRGLTRAVQVFLEELDRVEQLHFERPPGR